MNKLILSILAVVLPAPLFAQEQVIAQEDEIRRYTVEVIVFRYAEDVGTGTEIFRPDPPAPPGDTDGNTADPVDPAVPQARTGPLPDIDLVLLPRADYQLGDTLARLERLDAYEPVMHFGWTQATWPEDETKPVPLHRFARPPAELDGTLTLYRGRFVHLVVDLRWRAPGGGTATREPPAGFNGYGDGRQPGEPPAPVWYRIREDRILKNGELRYFDHPKFGLLVRMTRVDDADDADEGELLGYPVQ